MIDNYRDIAEFYDPDLRLPIRGVTYTIQAPSKAKADRLRAALTGFESADDERATYEDVLGEALAAMVANDVPDPIIGHAGRTALLHFAADPETAVTHWHLGPLGTAYSIAELLRALRDTGELPPATTAAD